MSAAPPRVSRAFAFVRTAARLVVGALRVALILALVFLPVPLASFLALAFVPRRDDPPAEIVRARAS